MIDWTRAITEWHVATGEIERAQRDQRWIDWELWTQVRSGMPHIGWVTGPWPRPVREDR